MDQDQKRRESMKQASGPLGLNLAVPLRALEKEVVPGGDELAEHLFVGAAGRARATTKQFADFRQVRPAIEDATGEVVNHLTPGKWTDVRRILLAGVTTVTLHPEAGVLGHWRAALLAVMRNKRSRAVFRVHQGERLAVSVYEWQHDLDDQGRRYNRREMFRALEDLGLIRGEHSVRIGNKYRPRTLYLIPEEIVQAWQLTDEEIERLDRAQLVDHVLRDSDAVERS